MNISELLAQREFDPKQPHVFTDRMYDHSYMQRRMELHHQLHGHCGCVNAIAWDMSGRWMISGSGKST